MSSVLENRKAERTNHRAIDGSRTVLLAAVGLVHMPNFRAKPSKESAKGRFRVCPVPACRKCGDGRHVLCRTHFRMLPRAMQLAIRDFDRARTDALGNRSMVEGRAERDAFIDLAQDFRACIHAALRYLEERNAHV